MIIYTFLLSIVLGLITNFLYQTANFRVNQKIENSLFHNSQLVTNKIFQDIKKAQTVIAPENENFVNTLILEAEEGGITYQVEDGVMKRNDQKLTDNMVEVEISSIDKGFRKINNSIQFKFVLRAKLKPFGQPRKEKVYQTTVALSS